jgi:hypothetical protein
MTAHAMSMPRRAREAGEEAGIEPSAGWRDAGLMTTERTIATWAMTQQAQAIQKTASATRKGMRSRKKAPEI